LFSFEFFVIFISCISFSIYYYFCFNLGLIILAHQLKQNKNKFSLRNICNIFMALVLVNDNNSSSDWSFYLAAVILYERLCFLLSWDLDGCVFMTPAAK